MGPAPRRDLPTPESSGGRSRAHRFGRFRRPRLAFSLTAPLRTVKLSDCRRVVCSRLVDVDALGAPGRGQMQTSFVKKAEIEHKWFVMDAEGQVLGRLASRIARILTGKEKPIYAPFLDTGDHVIVINADKVRLTGAKEQDKQYYRHSGYPGGIRQLSAREVRAKHPERLVEAAVRGMLPKNRLGRAQFRKLKVYAGTEHPHQAQKPQPLGYRESTASPAGKTSAGMQG